MSDQEIIAALRVLVADIEQLGESPITKDAALKLLRTQPGKPGALVEWFNRESDPRRRAVLRELIRLTVGAGYRQGAAAIAEATDRLSALVDRLDDSPKAVNEDDPWVPVRLEHVVSDRSTMLRHAKKPSETGVSKEGRGRYRIRRSRLGDYLMPKRRSDYGL